jgi:hypothetical protein
MQTVKALSALVAVALLVSGCGGSHHVSGSNHAISAERAAITVAQRKNGYLRLFPSSPGTRSCRIPMGGPTPGRLLRGHCATSVSRNRHSTRVDFIERSHNGEKVQSGGWTVLVDKHHRIGSVRVHGWVPQLIP